jgi:enoyl-CoA hydratase
MPVSEILFERSNHLATVRLNRPETGNRLTMRMFALIAEAFTEIEADPAVRCTLMEAAGDDFSVGVDVPDVLPAWSRGQSPIRDDQVNPWGVTGRPRNKPLVLVVQGRCHSGGLELALAADIVVAADDAQFAFEELRFGTYPFAGGVFRMIRAAGWGRAMRHVLTAEPFGADAALSMNVAAMIRPRAEAHEAGMALARRIAAAAPLAVQASLAQARNWARAAEAAALADAVPQLVRLLNSADASEAMAAMRQARVPVFIGQ